MSQTVSRRYQPGDILGGSGAPIQQWLLLQNQGHIELLKSWLLFEEFPQLVCDLRPKIRKMQCSIHEQLVRVGLEASRAGQYTSAAEPKDLFEEFAKRFSHVRLLDYPDVSREVRRRQKVVNREVGAKPKLCVGSGATHGDCAQSNHLRFW